MSRRVLFFLKQFRNSGCTLPQYLAFSNWKYDWYWGSAAKWQSSLIDESWRPHLDIRVSEDPWTPLGHFGQLPGWLLYGLMHCWDLLQWIKTFMKWLDWPMLHINAGFSWSRKQLISEKVFMKGLRPLHKCICNRACA